MDGRPVVDGRRVAMLWVIALATVVTGSALVATAGSGAEPRVSTSIEIVIRHSKFEPARIAVPVGVPVTITFRNTDPIDHEWIVGDHAVHALHRVGTEPLHPDRPTEVVIPAMQTRSTTITFEAAGRLQFICHLPAHEAYGMVGTVLIR